jgi:hypothetical protein
MGREIVTKLVIKNSKVFEATGHLSRAGNTFFIEHAEPKEYTFLRIWGYRVDQGLFFDTKEEALKKYEKILIEKKNQLKNEIGILDEQIKYIWG